MNNQSIFTRAGVFCCRIIAVILFGATAVAGLNSAFAANSAPPNFLTYQGYLADGNGAPLGAATPINYPVVFRIYDSQTGGNLIWSELQTVTVDNGQFSVVLGEGADNGNEIRPPLSTLFGSSSASDRFLDMTATIGGNVLNIVPRLRFLPSPYSFLASQANELVNPSGTTLISSTANGDLNITGSITTAGSIANSATTATPGNFGNTIVMRDVNANFQAANVSLSGGLKALNANVTSLRASAHIGGHLQGAHLEWNYTGRGASYLLNQKGTGVGGIVFGEVDAGTGITERMRIAHDGRVGIGTSSPNENLVVNSKAGGSRIAIDAPSGQFSQLYFREAGVLKSAISYLPPTARTHFYNNGVDVMIMDHLGRIGVGGGVAPGGTLHVQGNAASRGGAGTAMFVATDVNGGAFPSHIHHGSNGDWYVRSASAAGKVIIQDTGGLVGVGTSSPTSLLEVRSNAATVGNGTAVFVASHIRGGDTASHVHFGPTGDWYVRSADRGGKVILQDTGGNVVVGPGNPSLGKLVVQGSGTATIGNHYTFYLDSVTGPHNGVFTLNDVSIFANNGIHANFIRVFSDARIKNIQGRSIAENDLRILEQIEITDYTHKDFIEKGPRSIKKVIGQQLEEVYPQAVTMSVGVIPDIYVKAPIKNGWVTLATDLKQGDRVRLISDSSDQIYDILEATPSGFRTEFETVNDDVFVFGREVDDFRVVDYEAIAMLNVSATQELARQVSALKKSEARIADLEKKASRVESLEGQVAELRELVAKLADKDSKVREVAVRSGASVRN